MIAAILAAAALPSARAPLFSATAAACADARLLASRAAAEEADAAVKAAYEAVRSDKSAAPALQQAQQLLSTLRHDEACRACEVSLLGCAGGESCAEALEALRAAGVSPDAACLRLALALRVGSAEWRAGEEEKLNEHLRALRSEDAEFQAELKCFNTALGGSRITSTSMSRWPESYQCFTAAAT